MNTVRPKVRCKVAIKRVEIARADRVETGGRLVEKDDLRIERERARQRHALGHAAGKFGRKFVADAGVQPDHFQLGDGQFVEQLLRQAQIFADRELQVLPHRQRRKQRALLEQHAPAPLDRLALGVRGGRHVDAEHLDGARRASAAGR